MLFIASNHVIDPTNAYPGSSGQLAQIVQGAAGSHPGNIGAMDTLRNIQPPAYESKTNLKPNRHPNQRDVQGVLHNSTTVTLTFILHPPPLP